MECPECKEIMESISMSGTDEEINVDYYCEKCGTQARLTWTPGKRVNNQGDEIPF